MHVTFGGIHEGNLAELRLLNDTTFPVRYNDKFYREVLTTLPEFTKYAYAHDQVVGAICCRVEEEEVEEEKGEDKGEGLQVQSLHALQQMQQQQQEGGHTRTPPSEEANGPMILSPRRTKRRRRLYIMTLGVQAAYRGQGIGSRLLTSVLDAATRPPHCTNNDPYGLDIEEIYLHVQTSNADAIHFYSKFGFVTREMIRNYYKRIEPPDCYILSRTLGRGKKARDGKRRSSTAASSTLADLATAATAAVGATQTL
jgi:ribosomal protein S18 acetylase RimI-like enzyme|eukprot:evm.model.NODE_18009_length_20417_cov_32.100063.2